MPSISSGHGPITELMQESSVWTGMPVNSPAAVYLSSGNDSRMLTVTHPDHLRAKADGGPTPEPFAFYVHVDKQTSVNRPGLDFRDANTQVDEWDREIVRIDRHQAILLKLTLRSDRYPERNVAVLRIRATNNQFTKLAQAEDWKTHCLITVCDGCAFGGNRHCENDISGRRQTNLLKLRPDWLITDHFRRGIHGTDPVPQDGQFLKPDDPIRFGLRFRHVGPLTTPPRPIPGEDNRDRYVRLYETVPTEYWMNKRGADADRGWT